MRIQINRAVRKIFHILAWEWSRGLSDSPDNSDEMTGVVTGKRIEVTASGRKLYLVEISDTEWTVPDWIYEEAVEEQEVVVAFRGSGAPDDTGGLRSRERCLRKVA